MTPQPITEPNPMTSRLIPSLILLAAASAPLAALDIDVRLTAGTAAVIDEVEASGTTQNLEEENSASGSLTAHVFLGDGLLGLMVGGGFRAAVHAGDQSESGTFFPGGQADVTYTGKALLLEAGLTIKPTPMWRIELRPQLTVGQGEIEIDVSGDNITGDAGDYVAIGGVVGNYLRFDWFEIGLDLGFESFAGKSEVSGTEIESTGEGFFAQLGVGVIF